MKLPRDVSGDELVGLRQRLGYEIVRQRGSQVRLRHPGPPAHMITVPKHAPVKPGTLHSILTDVGVARSKSVEELAALL